MTLSASLFAPSLALCLEEDYSTPYIIMFIFNAQPETIIISPYYVIGFPLGYYTADVFNQEVVSYSNASV